MVQQYTTVSMYHQTRYKIDEIYFSFNKQYSMKKTKFIDLLFTFLQNADWEAFAFFLKNIKDRYQQDYDIVIIPVIIADIENKTFYNIYADLRDFNFSVVYSVGDLHKALLFLKPELAVKYIR